MSFFITLFCFVLQKCIVAAITTTSSLLDSVLKRKILSDLSDSVIRWLASKGVSRVGCPPCHTPPPSPRKQNKYNIMKILSIYLPVKFINSLKSKLIFNIFYCFGMFVNILFTYLTCAHLKSKRCLNVKSSTYFFQMKTDILLDLQICISVP